MPTYSTSSCPPPLPRQREKMRAARDPGDYTPVQGDESPYYRDGGGEMGSSSSSSSYEEGERPSNAERHWPADARDPRVRFEPPPPPGPVDPWEGFTVHTAVTWGVALLCVWLALRWLGAKHETLTGEMHDADRKRAELAEEERKKKVSSFYCVWFACVLPLPTAAFVSSLASTQPRAASTRTDGSDDDDPVS